MVSSTILEEVRRFCQTTSVRGVPRITNSKSLLHSIIWTIGVLTCVSLLIWQMTVIFKRYMSFGFNTVIVRSPDWDNATFPDVTICNLYPLVNDKEMNLSYTDYISTLKNQFTCGEEFKKAYNLYSKTNDTQSFNTTCSSMNTFLKSATGYFLNFPIAQHFQIIRKLADTPLVDCKYFNWDYTTSLNFDFFAYLQPRYMPELYKCYTISLNETFRKNALAFTAVFYVDDFLEILDDLYNDILGFGNTQATGIQVLIHPSGSAPDMTLGIPVGTGMATTITLSQTKVTHLPSPYSNCTTQKTIGELDPNTTYTVEYCISVCLQKKYIEECGCVTGSLKITTGQLHQTNGVICGNASITNRNSSINYEGAMRRLCETALNPNQDMCKQECLTPCNEYQYVLSASGAPWPHKSAQIAFYKQYIRGNPRYGNQFDIYETALNSTLNISEINDFLQKTDRQGLLKNRFLQVNIQFFTSSYLEQKDVADFSFDAFGAQVGGVLSLWLGVTVILVFELCEVVINLLTANFRSKGNKEDSTKEKEISDTQL